MKNFLLFVFAFLFLALTSVTKVSAQLPEANYKIMLSTTTGLALDTVTNTGARSQIYRVAGYNAMLTIVSTVTEISGTTAGSVKLYGSLNGVNYAEIDSTTVFSPADITTAQSYAWYVNPSPFTYYKVTYTGAGTMAAKFASSLLRR